MTQDSRAFVALEEAETMLDSAKVIGSEDQDYQQLLALLRKERELDLMRLEMFDKHEHGSDEANDYLYREYMVRHRISEFASKLDKKVIDNMSGDLPEEQSFVAEGIRNGEIYPKPIKK